MFSNANVEILLDDVNITTTRVYLYFSIFVVFWVDPNINICKRVQKKPPSIVHMFHILRVEHVSIPLLDMLHQCTYCHTITTLKLKK
jgi:hypothetical protein